MLFDSLMLRRIASDLRCCAVGAHVDRVFASGPDEAVLELRRRLPRPQIVLCWSAELGRVHLGRDLEPQPDLHLAFVDVLRKHLRGAVLTECRQVGFDRVLHLEFANCAGLGPQSRATLVAELMGRRSNVVLVDEEGIITSCAKQITREVNRYRETLPGVHYVPPPSFGRIDPHEVTSAWLSELLEGSGADSRELSARLRQALMGASDLFLDELLARAGQCTGEPPAARPAGLLSALGEMLAEAEREGPGFLYFPVGDKETLATQGSQDGLGLAPAAGEQDGRPSEPSGAERFAAQPPTSAPFAYPLRLRSRRGLAVSVMEDLSEALELLSAHLRAGRAMSQRRQRLEGVVQRALHKAQVREHERQRALAEAQGAEELRKRGELILANAHTIAPGATEVTVIDYHDPTQPLVTIPLDARLSAGENAQALFARYKRQRRGAERLPSLLRQAQKEREYLEGVLEQLAWAGPGQLAELEAEIAQRVHRRLPAREQPKGGVGTRGQLGSFTSSDGFTVLYGKTGTQNDALVRIADGDDLWFHVRQGPGGHVVIRTGGRPDRVPEATIREAASMAASLSRWRTAERADVDYTLVKHVRKPKGAPPGFVTYTASKTISVPPRRVGESE